MNIKLKKRQSTPIYLSTESVYYGQSRKSVDVGKKDGYATTV